MANYDYAKVAEDRSCKKNRKGQGRKLSYPTAIDEKILEWVLFQRENHLSVSSQLLQDKAMLLVKPHNPAFHGSTGWLRRFVRRHNLVLRASTSVAQKLPRDLECKIEEFKQEVKVVQLSHSFPPQLVGNMDETPMFFDMVPQCTIEQKGVKQVRN